MHNKARKFRCPACGQDSLVKTITKYDGFTPVGEVDVCAFCGKELDDTIEIISEEIPESLQQKGQRRVCYLCSNYVVNPFIQKCVLTDQEVEALDSCSRFQAKPPDKKKKEEDSGEENPLSIF